MNYVAVQLATYAFMFTVTVCEKNLMWENIDNFGKQNVIH